MSTRKQRPRRVLTLPRRRHPTFLCEPKRLSNFLQNLAKVAASIEARKEKEANSVPEALGALARDPQQVRTISRRTEIIKQQQQHQHTAGCNGHGLVHDSGRSYNILFCLCTSSQLRRVVNERAPRLDFCSYSGRRTQQANAHLPVFFSPGGPRVSSCSCYAPIRVCGADRSGTGFLLLPGVMIYTSVLEPALISVFFFFLTYSRWNCRAPGCTPRGWGKTWWNSRGKPETRPATSGSSSAGGRQRQTRGKKSRRTKTSPH